MYLLFADESGTHDNSPVTILAGLAVQEQDAWYLQGRLDAVLRKGLPAGLDPDDFELHAGEMKSPQRYARVDRAGKRYRVSPWEQVPYPTRMILLRDSYRAIATYPSRDTSRPCAMFGVVIDNAGGKKEQFAYEEILHRFDEMLTRQGHTAGGSHERGLVVHDARSIERDVQKWTHRWRHVRGRIGTLTHLADVPFFGDSRASRLIQAADFVAWALWRSYGLPKPDDQWIDLFWDLFDADAGKMHGLIHITPDFRTGVCQCRPCANRRTAAAAPLPAGPPP
jgi:Protein of unknown function (DUF3800)